MTRGAGGFIVRFVLYAIVVGIAIALARAEWAMLGLDAANAMTGPVADRVARWNARLPVALAVGTVLAAALGGLWRHVGALLVGALVGAIVTAPFAVLRALGG